MKKDYKKLAKMIGEGKIHLMYGINDDVFRDSQLSGDHMIDAMRYSMVSIREMELTDNYVLLHIRKKPRLLPEFIWAWLLSKLLKMDYFKRVN